MQIVIDIPEDVIEGAKSSPNYYPTYHFEKIWKAIANGTPLQKGHGKIGDLDRLYNVFEKNVVSADAFKELFDHAPTIIEADTESEVEDKG